MNKHGTLQSADNFLSAKDINDILYFYVYFVQDFFIVIIVIIIIINSYAVILYVQDFCMHVVS